eukprot:6028466-Amphidinium_carterae.1
MGVDSCTQCGHEDIGDDADAQEAPDESEEVQDGAQTFSRNAAAHNKPFLSLFKTPRHLDATFWPALLCISEEWKQKSTF